MRREWEGDIPPQPIRGEGSINVTIYMSNTVYHAGLLLGLVVGDVRQRSVNCRIGNTSV